MTPEQQPHEPIPRTPTPETSPEIEPPADHLLPRHESLAVTREIIARLTDSTDKLRVLEGVLSHGSPFAAYLTLNDVDLENPRLDETFKSAYIASYETLDQFIDDQIEALGWDVALATFRVNEGIGEDVLHWDRDALIHQIREMFDLRDLDNWWHLFAR